MDIQKLLEFGINYFSDYFSDFILTLKSPTARFDAIKESKILLISGIEKNVNVKLNPKLFGFLIISIFLGSTINSFVPRRPNIPDLSVTIIVTLAIWVAYSLTIYGMFRILGGKGYFWEIMSVSLQLLAVIYVTSNIIMFIWSVLAQFSLLISLIQRRSNILFEYPTIMYSLVQLILMLFYLPIALKKVHDFGKVRRIIVSFLPAFIWTVFGISLFFISSMPLQTYQSHDSIVAPPTEPPFEFDYMAAPTEPPFEFDYMAAPTTEPAVLSATSTDVPISTSTP